MKIELTHGKFTYIDDEDFEIVKDYKWRVGSNKAKESGPYAVTTVGIAPNRTTVYMHKLITGFEYTDHMDGDGFNNRKSNLRITDHVTNHQNQKARKGGTSKFKGVGWRKDQNKWQARIRVNKKLRFLGFFIDESEAAKAYDRAALKYFGEYARTNEMLGLYDGSSE